MAYAFRGKRVAYDNVAVGSIAGFENHISGGDVSDVSFFGDTMDQNRGRSNISNASLPGVEDTDNASADKMTSDGETVID